jgi:outer membrane protein OmpA-like peptidoglycan-associated protein
MDQYRCSDTLPDDCSEVVGTVIGGRVVGVVALGVALSRRTWLEATIPAAAQWGGSVDELSPDGVVLGDPRIGVRTRIVDGPQTLDAYAEGSIPLGQHGAWFADTLPTGHFGVVGTATAGRVTGLLDVAGWVRKSAASNPWDFRIGSALLVDAGIQVVVTEHVSLWTVAQSRISGGTPAVVASAGLACDLGPELRVDIGVGRALAIAPGAGPLHGRLTLTYRFDRAERVPVTTERIEDVVSPDAWADGEDFRVRDGQVELRQPVAFHPELSAPSSASFATIVGLAQWLVATDNVEHLLIAAYSNSEGTSAANYSLSLSRAQALADALVTAGVPRSRLSYKGMGMLAPDAESGEHHVVVDGEVLTHTTLNVADNTAQQAGPTGPSFDVWFAAQPSDTP